MPAKFRLLIFFFFLLFFLASKNSSVSYACDAGCGISQCFGQYDCNCRQVEHTTCSGRVCTDVSDEGRCLNWEVQTYSCSWYSEDCDTCCGWTQCQAINDGVACGTDGHCSNGSCIADPTPAPTEAPIVIQDSSPCGASSCDPNTEELRCSSCGVGGSCWCAPIGEGGSGAGSCSEPAPGAAPCIIGLCGSWYCNGGQWQSYCAVCDGGGDPVSTPTPAPGCVATTCGACNQTCGDTGLKSCTNGCSSWNEACNRFSCNGSITGSKVLMPGNTTGEPATSQTVYVDGSISSLDNPFAFNDLTAVAHTASVSVPTYYSAGYTMCYNDTTCHENDPTPGSSVSVNVPSGGYADLYWHFSCTSSAPAVFALSYPGNGDTVGNVAVTLNWDDESDFGFQCPSTTDKYTLYIDKVNTFDSADLQTFDIDSAISEKDLTLTDQTRYFWKVVADNGTQQRTSTGAPWSFWIRQPKVCGSSPASTLFEDVNQNGCYEAVSENPVAISGIQISTLPAGSCTTTDNTYCCTIPVDASNTPVTLSASNYSPYTGTTNCSSCGACVLNGCQPLLSPGDELCVNIGFEVKPWFQADGGSVYSNGDITSIIPANAEKYDNTVLNFDKYFVLNQAGTVLTNETLDFGLLGSASTLSRNWKDVGYSVNLSQFNYNFFQTRLGNKATLIEAGDISDSVVLENGILTSGVNTWPITNNSVFDIRGPVEVNDSNNLDGISAVIMSSDNITINNNFTPASSFAFIASGNIVVDDSVSEIHGLYFANGSFSDGDTTDRGLKIKGSVTALTQINLQRKWSSSYKPAEYFVADPALYVNLATSLGMPSYTWSEVAP